MKASWFAGKMRNRKFRATEEAIFEAVVDVENAGEDVRSVALSRKVGISRVTLFRHHRRIGKIRDDYRKLILGEYRDAMRKMMKTLDAEQLLYRMLFFIVQNKKMCRFLMKDRDELLVYGMLECLREKLKSDYRIGVYSEVMFEIYVAEVSALIREWGKKNYPEAEISRVHRDLVHLSSTAEERLERVGKWS